MAVAVAGTSSTAVDGLAGIAGWARDVRPALPVIVDVLAAVSTRAWLSGPVGQEVRRFARRTALFTIALSMAGNVAAHLLSAGWIRPSIVLVIGVLPAAFPPSRTERDLVIAARRLSRRALRDTGKPVTLRAVMAELGVGQVVGRQIRAKAVGASA